MLNLGRIGHYHTPHDADSGSCQTAIVVDANETSTPGIDLEHGGSTQTTVNLAIWTHQGEPDRRGDVPVAGKEVLPGRASFHLCADCPYGR